MPQKGPLDIPILIMSFMKPDRPRRDVMPPCIQRPGIGIAFQNDQFLRCDVAIAIGMAVYHPNISNEFIDITAHPLRDTRDESSTP